MISYELRILLAFLVAYFSAVFVIPKLANIARSIGLIDRPDSRKVHLEPRPLVGGIGMVIAATFSSMLFVDLKGLRGLFLGLAVLLFVGFLDDFRQLDARRKFLAQLGAAVLMMYFSKVFLVSFGDLLGVGAIVLPDSDLLIWAVTIFCLVGVINAINMIDGLDGLAGGISFIAFLTFGLHASFADARVLMLLNLAFAGAVLGFLRYNWSPARVFMGDAGSLCLGFTLGFMAIAMSQGETPVFSPVVPLLILAVPITDTLTVMGKRIIRGRGLFLPDRYHFHHILMRCGMVREKAVMTILGISLLLSGITIFVPFYQPPEWMLFGVYVFYFGGYVVTSQFIVSMMKHGLKDPSHQQNDGKREERGRMIIGSWVRILLKGLDYAKILRKDVRYEISLQMRCCLADGQTVIEGWIENVSRHGCMAMVPDLKELQQHIGLELILPLDHELHIVSIEAEHIWFNEEVNGRYHGFHFLEIEEKEQEIFYDFLTRCRRHKKN